MPISRRRLLASATALPCLGWSIAKAESYAPALKIMVAGGHPGDPECGCAGTIARYTGLGHEVVLLYLNRGEGFCGGASLDRCAAIRTAEARQACQSLKARAAFAGQYDGRAIVDAPHYEAFARVLAAEGPDVVFTQWPIDRHRDHRAVSMLILDAWLKSGQRFALYYYEVAEDTMMFSPTDYVDISSVESARRTACYAHASQRPITHSSATRKANAPCCHDRAAHDRAADRAAMIELVAAAARVPGRQAAATGGAVPGRASRRPPRRLRAPGSTSG